MRLFSFLYIATSYMAHACYLLVCITFLNMLPLVLFSLYTENVRQCCKAQSLCRPENSAIQKLSSLLLLKYLFIIILLSKYLFIII